MLIAIISDTHGNSATFAKFAAWAKQNQITAIIHCGDFGFADFAKEMADLLPQATFHMVSGNMDTDGEKLKEMIATGQIPNLLFYGQTGQIELAGKKIAFTHKPENSKNLAQIGQFDLVFFGHTHKPSEAKSGHCRLINPGNLAGEIFRSTFAVYDTTTDRLGSLLKSDFNSSTSQIRANPRS